MANNIYVIDVLATGTPTVTVTDDGTGLDWLDFNGVYASPTSIRLEWTTQSGIATSASGFYFSAGNIGHRLVVNGLIENVRGSDGSDFITGNHAANFIYGDQSIAGVGRADTISGGAGRDTILGGAGSDSIGGDDGHDDLRGGTGADTISGGAGVDTISGDAGADILSGGSEGGDQLSYRTSTAGVRVSLTYGSTTIGIGGHAAGDRIFGFTQVAGSAFADVLIDTVRDSASFGDNSVFYGGGGDDILQGNGGFDKASGGAGNDRLFGGADTDTLTGGDGDDMLVGGLGGDILFGNDGADKFIFTSVNQSFKQFSDFNVNRDTIHDFSRSDGDRIDLSGIDAVPGGANNAFRFVGSNPFSAAGDLRVVDTGTGFLVLGDQNGDGRAEFSLEILNVASLIAADFNL
jgi:serralysin